MSAEDIIIVIVIYYYYTYKLYYDVLEHRIFITKFGQYFQDNLITRTKKRKKRARQFHYDSGTMNKSIRSEHSADSVSAYCHDSWEI